jgi:hypothetical protein
VSRPASDKTWLATTEVNDLSRYCEALWHFNIVPERLVSYKQWNEHQAVSDPPSDADDNTSGSTSSSGSAWFWNNRFADQWNINTSLSIARAALVLGRKKRFKAEIKLLVWQMKGDWLDGTTTTVERLSVEHLKGKMLLEAPSFNGFDSGRHGMLILWGSRN